MTSTPETEPAQPAGAATGDEPAVVAEALPDAETAAARPVPVPVTPTPEELALAVAALDEIAAAGAVGEVLDAHAEGERVLALRYASTLPGYPDWTWTVLLSRGLEGGPSVLEATLLPGEGSLLAPAWVPWADRLAEYLAAKDASSAEGDDHDDLDPHDDDLESDLEDDLEDDFDDDFDEDDADHEDADDDDADAHDPADEDGRDA